MHSRYETYDEINGDMNEIWSDDEQPAESKKNEPAEQTRMPQSVTVTPRTRSSSFFSPSSPISIANSGHATPPNNLDNTKKAEETTFKPGRYEEDTMQFINNFVSLNRR